MRLLKPKIYTLYVLLLAFCHTEAATLEVGPGKRFSTIKSALNHAQPGDTVNVAKGVYYEQNIQINKPVSLIGTNLPVLDGQKKYEVITVNCSRVVVDGFKIQYSGHSDLDDLAGIKIYNARNVIIQNNVLDSTYFAILTQYGVKCTIRNNTIKAYGGVETQNGNGIHCWKSDSLLITGNRITGHRDGIYFEFVTNSSILKNVSRGNVRYGLHFMFSHNDSYVGNTFSQNGAGVAVMYTRNIRMHNNLFENNWGDAAYGLLLKEISDSHVSGNKFINNTMGVYMESSNRITLEKNLFLNNGWALRIQASCESDTVRYSNFSGNTFDVATNGSLVQNFFQHNYWDKYEGYDLNKDNIGDVPYRPVSLYSMIIEKNPSAIVLFRSFITALLDRSEKVIPTLIPENLKDNSPAMKLLKL